MSRVLLAIFTAMTVLLLTMVSMRIGRGEEAPGAGCAPAAVVEWVLSQREGLHNFRAVATDKVVDAAEIFNELPPGGVTEWRAAWLMGHENGGGVLLVGYPDLVCASVKLAPQHWYAITLSLEGVRV